MKTILVSAKKLLLTRFNLIIYSLAFFIPVFISQPQWLTGTVVNGLLFLTVTKFSRKSVLPVMILPSLGAITNGILFGPQTVFLYYFLPFIWMGNYLLVSIFSLTKNQPYFLRIIFAALAKYLLLVVFAQIYFGFKVVPQLFLTSMGIIQLVTALSGGVFAFIILQFLQKEKYE